MKTQSISVFQKPISILWVMVLLTTVTTLHATTHVVQFGGTFGFTYSPNSLNVSEGDTVQWEGDFSMHPLSSTSVPVGASSFNQAFRQRIYVSCHSCRVVSISLRLPFFYRDDRIVHCIRSHRYWEWSDFFPTRCFQAWAELSKPVQSNNDNLVWYSISNLCFDKGI